MQTEIVIPAIKFWYRRLLSLLGIKVDFKTFMISNTRYDSCMYSVFGLGNEVVHHLLTPRFFVWFVEWNELMLIHHRFISHD